IPPPPAGLNYIAVIKPSLVDLLLNTAGGAILLPLLCTLFIFSDHKIWRTAIFWCNLMAILTGITLSVLGIKEQITVILSPMISVPARLLNVYGTLSAVLPIFTDAIPLLRVLTVYPPRSIPVHASVYIYVPIILIKIGRLTNVILFLKLWFSSVASGGSPVILGKIAW
ncbi:hypothetical protein M422DRAFT_83986, partial [Sphaerobolus stellatus SS14]